MGSFFNENIFDDELKTIHDAEGDDDADDTDTDDAADDTDDTDTGDDPEGSDEDTTEEGDEGDEEAGEGGDEDFGGGDEGDEETGEEGDDGADDSGSEDGGDDDWRTALDYSISNQAIAENNFGSEAKIRGYLLKAAKKLYGDIQLLIQNIESSQTSSIYKDSYSKLLTWLYDLEESCEKFILEIPSIKGANKLKGVSASLNLYNRAYENISENYIDLLKKQSRSFQKRSKQ